jgi:hypothetical protein
VYLDTVDYASLVVIDPRFPYGVTRKHAADGDIAGSRWGRHGGPMVTTSVYGATGVATPSVERWSLPAIATDPATKQVLPVAIASALPTRFFYGADGMVDLPFGELSLFSYSTPGAAFPGEALAYSSSYERLVSRANANGFYSGLGITDGVRQRLVYSSLSAMSHAASTTNDNGLYATDMCAGTELAAAGCTAVKLFGWHGASGPVAADTHGNVFVAASVVGGEKSDTLFGLARGQALASAPESPLSLVDVNFGGTASLAVLPPAAGRDGWVLGEGFTDGSEVYAASFSEAASGLQKGAQYLEQAIKKGPLAQSITLFSDNEGNLWLAITTESSGVYLQLQPRVATP